LQRKEKDRSKSSHRAFLPVCSGGSSSISTTTTNAKASRKQKGFATPAEEEMESVVKA
jgi:hypothetical protein